MKSLHFVSATFCMSHEQHALPSEARLYQSGRHTNLYAQLLIFIDHSSKIDISGADRAVKLEVLCPIAKTLVCQFPFLRFAHSLPSMMKNNYQFCF